MGMSAAHCQGNVWRVVTLYMSAAAGTEAPQQLPSPQPSRKCSKLTVASGTRFNVELALLRRQLWMISLLRCYWQLRP